MDVSFPFFECCLFYLLAIEKSTHNVTEMTFHLLKLTIIRDERVEMTGWWSFKTA
jgi:hypothetical protein